MAIKGTTFDRFPGAPQWHEFFDDFDNTYALTSNLPVSASSPWIGASLNGGTATFAQSAFATYGDANLSTGTTGSDDGIEIVSDYEFANLVTGKRTQFMARFKAGSTSTGLWFLGASKDYSGGAAAVLGTTATLASCINVTDAWGFVLVGGVAYGVVRRDAVQLATAAYTLDYTAYTNFAIEFVMGSTAGSGYARFIVNDTVEIGRIDSTTMPYETEETMRLAIAGINSTGAANTAAIGYIGCRVER